MDGQFVPNLTFGPDVIASVRGLTSLPFEAHLMVLSPDAMAARWVEAGCQRLIVHAEACTHLHRVVQQIRGLGKRAGVSLNPHTPEESLRYVLPSLDLVLVMSVNPGFGGQDFLPEVLPKIASLRAQIDALGLATDLQVDGGIKPGTAARVCEAGADSLVAGNAVFKAPAGYAAAIAALRADAVGRADVGGVRA
jgi:ribulose-phosphate 3-epimerase